MSSEIWTKIKNLDLREVRRKLQSKKGWGLLKKNLRKSEDT